MSFMVNQDGIVYQWATEQTRMDYSSKQWFIFIDINTEESKQIRIPAMQPSASFVVWIKYRQQARKK